MAKKPAKKEEGDAPEGDAPAGGGKKKLIIMAGGGAAALLVIGGAAAYFLGVFGGSKPDDHGAAAHVEAPKEPVFLDLPEMTVNLSSVDGRAAFLKVKIALEVSDKEASAKIQPVLPRVLDTFQIYLRELRSTDLDGSAGLFRVKEELQRRINIAIHPSKVDAVLFRDILVQ